MPNIRRKMPLLSPSGISLLFLLIFLAGMAYSFSIPLFIEDRYAWHVLVGKKYFEISLNGNALSHAQKALSLDEERLDAYVLLQRIRFQMGNYTLTRNAIDDMLWMAVLHNDSSVEHYAYFRMGRSYLEQNNLTEALRFFTKGAEDQDVKRNRNLAYNYLGIGIIRLKQNDPDAALENFMKIPPLIEESPEPEWFEGMVFLGINHAYMQKGLPYTSRDELQFSDQYVHHAASYFYNLVY